MTMEDKAKNEEPQRLITYTPPVDILVGPDETVLIADMPGVDERSVEADLENDVLTLKGQRHIEVPAGCSAARTEYAPTVFRRTFEVSHEIDRSRIKAAIRNGVLRVTLPRADYAKPRKITISSN